MKLKAPTGTVRGIAATRMPTKWGMFRAVGFEREVLNGSRQIESALALVLGDVTKGVPLVRIHSQCLTGVVDLRTSGGPRHRFDGKVAGLRAAGYRF